MHFVPNLSDHSGKEVIVMVTVFIVTVAANVVSYFICKWLDKRN